MRSYTSGSKLGALFYAKLLPGICAFLIVAFELLSDFMLKHYSETYARVSRQYAEAVNVRPGRPGEAIPVLIVGNSLLLEAIDVDRLKGLTSGQMRIYPIFLEATGYYDWLYALQRLFREGSRPQVVVFGVGVDSFLADTVRQDYAPLILFDAEDSLGVASDLRMDRTATGNLLLAHSSAFWDTRSVFRTQILRHTVSHYEELVSLLKPQPVVPPALQFRTVANSRLERLRHLCHTYGAKLIILVPPTPSSEDAIQRMVIASREAGVDTLVPIDPAALSTKYYQPDELHLNPEGAQLFTSALANFLPKTLDHEQEVSPN